MNPGEDARLAAAMASGSHSAFDILYQHYEGHVSKIVHRILRVKCVDLTDHAKQVKQDVWIKLWQRADKYDKAKGEFVPWLNVLVKNLAIEHIRKCDTRTTSIENTEGTGILGSLPVESGEARLFNRILLGELWDRFDEQERTFATLYFIEGLNDREIARILDIQENLVRVRRYRLVHRLRKLAGLE